MVDAGGTGLRNEEHRSARLKLYLGWYISEVNTRCYGTTVIFLLFPQYWSRVRAGLPPRQEA